MAAMVGPGPSIAAANGPGPTKAAEIGPTQQKLGVVLTLVWSSQFRIVMKLQ